MNPKIRKIIAREGLIIISILSLAGISHFTDYWINNQKNLYEENVKEIQVVIKDSPSYPSYDPLNINQHNHAGGRFVLLSVGKILRFPKNTNNTVIEQTIRRDFPNINGVEYITWDSPTGKNISASYDNEGHLVFDNIIYEIDYPPITGFFLIFAYPLYLLLRFVVWALKTLKEHN